MTTERNPRGHILLLALFMGSHLILAGCNDESRTSGTMVEVSEEAKKNIESKREAYKAKAQEKAKSRKDQAKVRRTR